MLLLLHLVSLSSRRGPGAARGAQRDELLSHSVYVDAFHYVLTGSVELMQARAYESSVFVSDAPASGPHGAGRAAARARERCELQRGRDMTLSCKPMAGIGTGGGSSGTCAKMTANTRSR